MIGFHERSRGISVSDTLFYEIGRNKPSEKHFVKIKVVNEHT